MISNARTYYQTSAAAMKPIRTQRPALSRAVAELHRAVIRPGALSVADKELIAVGIALAVRCEHSIYAHVQAAIRAGVKREQILEAAEVAVLIQGGSSFAHLPRVIDALDAFAHPVPPAKPAVS